MIEQSEISAFVATATSSLEAIRSLGIDWRHTRFRRYIDRVAKQVKETKTPIDNLLVEGTCQLLQVRLITSLFADLDKAILKEKLKLVLKGKDLQDATDDTPRNTLLEFLTAFLLREAGNPVGLTRHDEDAWFQIGTEKIAVECKRPATSDTVNKNLAEIRKQLLSRGCGSSRPKGLAVLGADRVYSKATGGPAHEAETEGEYQQSVSDVNKVMVGLLVDRAATLSLTDVAVVGMSVLPTVTLISNPPLLAIDVRYMNVSFDREGDQLLERLVTPHTRTTRKPS